MTPIPRTTLLAALAAAACAGAQAAGSSRFKQADYATPPMSQFSEEGQRAILQDGYNHGDRADQAAMSGNLDQSRAENRSAAEIFAKFADKFTSSEYRIVMRTQAAERYMRAQDFERSAAQAQLIFDDPESLDVSKAIAARLTAGAWQMVAVAEGRAGRVDPPRLLAADKRQGQEPKPRVPPDPWKRFIESADRYQSLRQADPLASLPPAESQRRGGVDAPQLANIAAQVEFGYDNMEDARRRYQAIIQTWPARGDVLESAVPYYLETFLVKKDDAGYEGAVAKALAVVKPEADKAAEAAKAPGAGDDVKKNAEVLARLATDLEKRHQGSGYNAASQLLAAGKPAEAAAAFEKFAADNPSHPDAANALYNAGVAWERAKEPKKAQAVRATLLERFPDAKVAPQAMLAQASMATRQGENAAAQKLYQAYLDKFGQGPQRCLALQNLGVALESMGKKLEAARNYQAFAKDESCLKEDANNAARVVYRGAVLFADARKKAESQDLFRIVAGMQGVSDTVSRSQVEDAKTRLKKGK